MFKKREICIVSVLAVVIAMVAYIYHDDQSYKFNALTDQHKARTVPVCLSTASPTLRTNSRSIPAPRLLSGLTNAPSPLVA